jgi:hypothetical protein
LLKSIAAPAQKKTPPATGGAAFRRAELVVGCLTSDLAHSSTGQAESQMMVVMRVADRSTHDFRRLPQGWT